MKNPRFTVFEVCKGRNEPVPYIGIDTLEEKIKQATRFASLKVQASGEECSMIIFDRNQAVKVVRAFLKVEVEVS